MKNCCYAVDASYSFKDLVLSTPSWTLSSPRKEEEDEEEDFCIDATKSKKKKKKPLDDFDAKRTKQNKTKSAAARQRKTRGDHAEEEEEEEEEEELLSSKMDVRPKKSKTSLADALFAKGSLADAAAKSRAWGGPGETAETRRSALSEWHKTVDKFRDDYKAKRKAAVKRSKRRVGFVRIKGGKIEGKGASSV